MFLEKGQLKLHHGGVSMGKYMENLFTFGELNLSAYFDENRIYNIKFSQNDSNINSIISAEGNFEINIHNANDLNQKKVLYNDLNELKIQETFYGYKEKFGVNFTCTVVWGQTGSPERYIFDFSDFATPFVYRKFKIPFVYVTDQSLDLYKSKKTKNLSKKEIWAIQLFLKLNGKKINFKKVASEGLNGLRIKETYSQLFQFCT